MTKYRVCQAFAKAEGWGILSSIPTEDNNPLDLRHSPNSEHPADSPNSIGQIDDIGHGWADADRQVELWAERGLTLFRAICVQLGVVTDPATGAVVENPDNNNVGAYTATILSMLPQCTVSTPMSEVLTYPAQ